ncbi:oxidoreductase [Hirsutella rhossiliensis]|uniref:Oxidoreductase n=1 Tax=Hirsutella rhossiliensis TaxID=111463 RepID=A0A9P8MZX5_9HYPO|nr:oxidoreductase [Hirsutella rhossiliensis]KAH0964320.1 oxidoreductase [Hirsutella rhossiliensis]
MPPPPSLPWIFICPSSRGIGRALTRRLLATTTLPVLATTRSGDTAAAKAALLDGLDGLDGLAPDDFRRLTVVRCDVGDEASVREAARVAATLFPPATHHLHLGCAVAGVLHAEKAPAGVDAELALESFRVNAVGPLVLAKHFFALLPRRATTVCAADASSLGALAPAHATWLAMAARVGSTTDNRAGGWFSYRASKAAVISLARSLDLFLAARSGRRALAVAYHPGSVRTDLSRDFWAGVAPGKLFSPEYAAERLVDVVGRMRVEQRGRCWDWKGDEVPP